MKTISGKRLDPALRLEASEILDGLAESFDAAAKTRLVGYAEAFYRRANRRGDLSASPLLRLARAFRATSRQLKSSALRHRDSIVLLTQIQRELDIFRRHRLFPRLMRLLRLSGLAPIDLDGASASLGRIIAARAPTSTGMVEDPALAAAVDLDAAPWQGLRSLQGRGRADAVTVVIPVYGGRTETLDCILSVLRAENETPAHLLIVDDQSPDERLSLDLRTLAEGGLLDLVRNARNQGFVGSVNTGMLASDGDVVLLNSDTIVPDRWLDHLRDAARSREDAGSISPLSNNATILSYPFINELNVLPEDSSLADLCRELEQSPSGGDLVEVPTTVGFCMYIPRRALRAVGLFDEPGFGLGYGEESDWAMRARRLGFRHYATTRGFVFHHGSVSFSASALGRQESAGEIIRKRYPYYWPLVAEHIAKDPLAKARRRLDAMRVRKAAGGRPVVLHILHSLGGGTDKHVQHVADALAEREVASLFAQPDHFGRMRILSNIVDDLPNLVFWPLRDDAELDQTLEGWNVAYIHVHNLLGYAPETIDWLAGTAKPLVVTLHDHALICPQITLIDHHGQFCGAAPTTACHRCIEGKRAPLEITNVAAWRSRMLRLLERAETVVSPSRSTAMLHGNVWPDLPIAVVPHSEDSMNSMPRHARRPDVVTVAIIGTIVGHKGARVIEDCVRDAAARDLPLKFAVCGEMPSSAEGPHLSISGQFNPDMLPGLIEASGATIGFLPSVWPETYSYVLSEYFRHGLHPVVFDLGAQAERVREAGFGTILPLRLDAGSINDILLGIAPEHEERQPFANSDDALLGSLYPRLFEDDRHQRRRSAGQT